jgi:hypothetical protein
MDALRREKGREPEPAAKADIPDVEIPCEGALDSLARFRWRDRRPSGRPFSLFDHTASCSVSVCVAYDVPQAHND